MGAKNSKKSMSRSFSNQQFNNEFNNEFEIEYGADDQGDPIPKIGPDGKHIIKYELVFIGPDINTLEQKYIPIRKNMNSSLIIIRPHDTRYQQILNKRDVSSPMTNFDSIHHNDKSNNINIECILNNNDDSDIEGEELIDKKYDIDQNTGSCKFNKKDGNWYYN